MLHTGMLSITFRKLSPQDVIDLVIRAGLDNIEWGGDIHAPHGDTDTAETIARQCTEAGIALPSYGSYYRAAVSEAEGLSFESVLDSASALGVDTVRVWANNMPSDRADEADWQATVDDLQRICDMAERRDMSISLEYHANTLTDTFDAAAALIDRVDRPLLHTYWQPRNGTVSIDEQVDQLEQLLPSVNHLHVFSWTFENGITRLPLEHNQDQWQRFFDVAKSDGQDRYVMMEFVKDDDPQQFLEDADTLKRWVG